MNNQTIDGVPREAIKTLLAGRGGSAQADAARTLRSLLEAPAGSKDGSEVERLIALCLQKDAVISEMNRIYSALHDAATDCADTLYCQSSQGADALEVLRSLLKSGLPAAQPQGEQGAWLDQASGAIVTYKLKSLLCESGFEIPLYAEQHKQK